MAQVLLDKHPHLKTVVNKTGNIDTEFRVFPMEVRSKGGIVKVLIRL